MIDWTPATIERARVLWHKRIPDGRFVYASGEIANALGITRDALAAKAKRLGFDKRPSTGKRRTDVPRPPRSVKLTDPIPDIEIELANLATVSGDLTCCRPMWALGERPTHLYCGAVVAEGQYYCAGHGDVVVVSGRHRVDQRVAA